MHALRTLSEGKRNVPQLLPLANDVLNLSKYLQKHRVQVGPSRLVMIVTAMLILLPMKEGHLPRMNGCRQLKISRQI